MSLLGKRLREEREARGLPFLQIELDTRIRANIIQSLEEGDLENLPPEPFLRGLIRSYANYLRINPQELLDLYEADTVPAPPPSSSSPARPAAGPHTAAIRPDLTIQPTDADPTITPSTKTWVRMPEENPPPPPMPSRSPSGPAAPRREPSAQSAGVDLSRQPASVPEPLATKSQDPLNRLRRRLPLAPPSPKPKNPALPSGRDRSVPPPIPPETLPPPEQLERPTTIPKPPVPAREPLAPMVESGGPQHEPGSPAQPELAPIARSRGGWPINLAQVPRSSIILMSVAIVSGLLACGLFSITRFAPALLSIAASATATPTRLAPTAVPTALPGTSPTGIPTIAATAPPFTPVPIVTQPTAKATPKRTLEAGSTDLNLDIDASQVVTAQIGIDGVMVFNGALAAGQSQSWSAKESLYMHVENPKGANIRFNTKSVLALNYGERLLIERQWVVKGGKVMAATPVPPPTPKPVSGQPVISLPTVPAATPSPTKPPAPTATLTPFS